MSRYGSATRHRRDAHRRRKALRAADMENAPRQRADLLALADTLDRS